MLALAILAQLSTSPNPPTPDAPALLLCPTIHTNTHTTLPQNTRLEPHHLQAAVAALLDQPGQDGAPLLPARADDKDAKPELTAVFLVDGLSSHALKASPQLTPNLDALLKQGGVSAPHTSVADAETPLFPRAQRVPADKGLEWLAANAHVASNGRPDLVVFDVEPMLLSAQDELVGRLARAIDASTAGKYAALITAASAPSGTRRRLAPRPTGPPLRITRDLLAGLIVTFILFVVFISGFCCLFSLQTPRTFVSDKSS